MVTIQMLFSDDDAVGQGAVSNETLEMEPGMSFGAVRGMYETVKAHLDSRGWTYEEVPGRRLIKAGARGKVGSFRVIFDIKEDRDIFLIYVMSQLNFPEERRDDVAIYLTYCSYSMTLGNFEMDLDDGETRFKVSVVTKDSVLSPEMVEEMLDVSLAMADRFFEGMVKVAYAGMNPKIAYDMALPGGTDSPGSDNAEARAQ